MKKVIAKNYFEKQDKLSEELGNSIEKVKSTLTDKERKEIIEQLDEVGDIFERILENTKK